MRLARRCFHTPTGDRISPNTRQSRALLSLCFRVSGCTQQLARMLNSLVRVSRRVRWAAVYSPPNLQCATLKVFAIPPPAAEPDLRPSSTTQQQSAEPNAYAGTCRRDRLTDKRATLAVRHRRPKESSSTQQARRMHIRQRRRRTNSESASVAAS